MDLVRPGRVIAIGISLALTLQLALGAVPEPVANAGVDPDPADPRKLLFWYFLIGPIVLFIVALCVVGISRRIRSRRDGDPGP
jgi:hypothetical protein